MRRATVFVVLLLAVQLAVPFVGNVTRADSERWMPMNNGLIFDEINSIVVDPQHSDTVYAGTGGFKETGDIYKSSDGGTTWKASNATDRGSGNVTEVGFILVDPSNTSVVFARTVICSSSGYPFRWSLLRSTDAGSTWKEVNNGLPTDEALLCLAIDPANTSLVYTGTGSGLFKSSDRGTSWTRINGGPKTGRVHFLLIDPTATSVIYGLGDPGAFTSSDGSLIGGVGVFKSTDGGLTWSPSGNRVDDAVWCLAFDATNTSIMYAGTYSGLLKSEDRGTSWSKVGLELDIESVIVDPSDTSTVYALTLVDGLFKSSDHGLTWIEIDRGLERALVDSLALDASNTSVLYAGTDGSGAFKSTDGGLTWNAINNGLEKQMGPSDTLCVMGLDIDPADTSVVYAWTCSGLAKTIDGGMNWKGIDSGLRYYGSATSFAVDPSNASVLYAFLPQSPTWEDIGLFKSTDGGLHWTEISDAFAAEEYVGPFVIDPSNTSTMYAGIGSGGISKSIDGGLSWHAVNYGLNVKETAICSLAVDPTNTSVIYAGNAAHGGFKSTDAGSTWTAFGSGLDEAGAMFTIAMDPSNTTVLYAGVGTFTSADVETGVFKSADAGSTWTAVNSGLGEFTNVISLAIDPTHSTVIYAGTLVGGVFRSADAGGHWQSLTGLATHSVVCLAIDPVNPTTLYAGTEGGLFRLFSATETIASPPSVPASLTATSSVMDIRLNWSAATAGTSPLGGYAVYRSSSPGGTTGTAVATVGAAVTNWTDTTRKQGVTYYYAVAAFDYLQPPLFSEKSSEVSARLLSPPSISLTLTLQLGNALMLVSGSDGKNDTVTLDAAPVLGAGSRTLVPVRAVAEAMGGIVFWDVITETATVTVGSNTLELTLGKNTALFNGTAVQIDTDPKVLPLIINGRTMLPLRFVVESLGAEVSYDQATKTITITYTKT
jgi:photosystem II stability/assembly factor-like uncharacterized protein